jgi:hypothetical protein
VVQKKISRAKRKYTQQQNVRAMQHQCDSCGQFCNTIGFGQMGLSAPVYIGVP